MAITRIEKPQWQPYFDRVANALGAKRVEIEVVGPDVGAQPEAHNIPLTGLTYDRKDDVFAVIGDGFEHNVFHPREIHVDQEADSLRSLDVIDADGDHHIVTLHDPLPLPPPH